MHAPTPFAIAIQHKIYNLLFLLYFKFPKTNITNPTPKIRPKVLYLYTNLEKNFIVAIFFNNKQLPKIIKPKGKTILLESVILVIVLKIFKI